MQLTIEEAIEWIHSRLPFGSRPGLDRINALLEKLIIQKTKCQRFISQEPMVKGSTVTYLRCLLEEMGLKVGTFTSPYIESFNEKLR